MASRPPTSAHPSGRAALLLASMALVALASLAPAASAAAVGNEKPGSCPPAAGVHVCVFKCYADVDCPWSQKCCGTLCGGSMCLNAVSAPLPRYQPPVEATQLECPAVGGTPWVCRSRCSSDAECRAGQRCCPHRCGGFSCLRAVPAPAPAPAVAAASDLAPRSAPAPAPEAAASDDAEAEYA